jgi:hypothetical protein
MKSARREATMKAHDALLNGYLDGKADTPWTRSPINFDDWKTGATETSEFESYWNGYYAGLMDAAR